MAEISCDRPMTSPRLSLVVPVFNEEENLPPLVEEMRSALVGFGDQWEAIFVDDGSTDSTPDVLRDLALEDPRVRVLRLRRNSGQSAAFAAGFAAARSPVVVTLDADLQNDPADIPRLVAELDQVDVVCGVRTGRQDSWVRLVSSRIANGVRNRLTRESIADVGCSLRAYRTDFVRRVPMFDGMHRFLPTLLRQDGARIKEVPVRHRPRVRGESKYGISNRLWHALADLFAVRWMLKRWVDRRVVEEVTPHPRRPLAGADRRDEDSS